MRLLLFSTHRTHSYQNLISYQVKGWQEIMTVEPGPLEVHFQMGLHCVVSAESYMSRAWLTSNNMLKQISSLACNLYYVIILCVQIDIDNGLCPLSPLYSVVLSGHCFHSCLAALSQRLDPKLMTNLKYVIKICICGIFNPKSIANYLSVTDCKQYHKDLKIITQSKFTQCKPSFSRELAVKVC